MKVREIRRHGHRDDGAVYWRKTTPVVVLVLVLALALVRSSGWARDVEFEPVYHFYGPHRAGLPPLVPYFRELWRRRAFAAEMSRASMRG